MKNIFAALGQWFGAQTIAVKALTVVLAVGVVGTAGAGVYMAANSGNTPSKEVIASVEQPAGSEAVQESTPADTKEEQTTEVAAADDKNTADAEQNSDKEQTTDPAEDYDTEDGENAGNAEYVTYEKTSDKLINGNFSDGLNGYVLYSINEGAMDYSISGGELNVTISDTGSEDWHVQLKQEGIRLEQGKWYQLTLDAKSSLARVIGCTMQKDGTNDNDWTPYSESAKLELGSSWETYTLTFQMTNATDAKAFFNLALGTIDGAHIGTTHTVSIRNISLTTLADNWMDGLKEDGNLIANSKFAYGNLLWDGSVVAPGAAKVSFKNNQAKFEITNTGTEDWHVQLKQTGIKIQKEHIYRLTFKASSTVARAIKIGFMDTNYVNWYGGGDVNIYPEEGTCMITFKSAYADNDNVMLMLSMGNPAGGSAPVSTITLSDFKLVELTGAEAAVAEAQTSGYAATSNPAFQLPEGWTLYDHENKHVLSATDDGENGTKIEIGNAGTETWHVQLQKKYVTLEKGKYYKVSYEVKSSEERLINYMMQHDGASDNNWSSYGPSEDSTFTVSSDWKSVENVFQMTSDTDETVIYNISLGMINGQNVDKAHSIWFRNLKIEETEAPKPAEIGLNDEMLKNTSFADNGAKWNIEFGGDSAGSYSLAENTVTFNITNVGTADWNVQLKQNGIKLEKGCKYHVSFKASSTAARTVNLGFLSTSYTWYGGTGIDLGTDEKEYTFEFVMNNATDEAAYMGISMGQIFDGETGAEIDTPVSSIVLKDLSLKKIAEPAPAVPALRTGVVKYGVPFDFNWSQYVPGVQIGDVVTLKFKMECSAGSFNGCIGANAGAEENYWYSVNYSESSNEVDVTFHVGASEQGNLQDYVKVESFWPQDETEINVSLISAEK